MKTLDSCLNNLLNVFTINRLKLIKDAKSTSFRVVVIYVVVLIITFNVVFHL